MVTIYQTEPLDRAATRDALALLEGAIPPAMLPQIFGIPVPVSDTEITMRIFLADKHASMATWLAAHQIGATVIEADLIDTSAWYHAGALAIWAGKTQRAPVSANH